MAGLDFSDRASTDAGSGQGLDFSSRAAPQRSLAQDVTGFMAKVNRGLGIGDELAAGANTAVNVLSGQTPLSNVVGDYQNSLARQRQIEDSYQAAHPHLAALATGTGNALTMAAPIGPGAEAFAAPLNVLGRQVPQAAANALRGATVAGLTGAGYAAVDRGSLGQRAQAAAQAAQDPVTLGLGAAVGAAATPRAAKAATQTAPTLDQLEAAKNAAYDEVSNSGARYTPEAFQGVLDNMRQRIADATPGARFNPKLYPKTADMLDHLQSLADEGYAPTPSELEQQRRFIGKTVAGASDQGERSMGVLMKGAIDDFTAKATPDQLVGASDPAAVAATLSQARDLNTRIVKLEKLDQLDQAASDRAAASGSGGNANNATRQNVIRFKNQVGNLTPDEQAAAQRVIDGTPLGNALRQVGKLSPSGNGLMLAGQLAAEAPTHGLSGAVGLGGAVAKALADASTSRNVQALRDLIASGGVAAQEVARQLADPQYADLRAQLANDLAAQAGVTRASQNAPIEVTIDRSTNPDYLAWRRAQGLPAR